MNLPRRIILGFGIFLAMLATVGCISIHRPIRNPAAKNKRQLMMASKDELVARIETWNKQIQSFVATVDMTPSTGSVYKGQITDYKDIRGYIIFRRPQDIRIIGQYPVVRATAFEMTSDGKEFKIYIPSKNRFVVGENQAPTASANKLENLRPQIFLQSMLIRPVDPATEKSALMDDTDEDHATSILLVLGTDNAGNPLLLRSVWFDRADLSIIRQETYAANGNILSDTRYGNWTDYAGVRFPSKIDINRPTDEFGVGLSIVKMEMNKSVTDQMFVLAQPPGSTLQVIGSPANVPSAPTPTSTQQKSQK